MTAQISGLTVQLVHGPSGTRIHTVPPVDNGGTGESFSPTDLVGAALAACALSTLALVTKREGLAWGDASATVTKEMTGPPRRIGSLKVVFQMPKEAKPDQRARLEEIARTCPVSRSLGPDVAQPFEFNY